MLEKECANHTFAIKYVDLMRRIAQEEKSDYSEKLLDQLQKFLSQVNRPVSDLSEHERQLAKNCIGML